MNKLLDTKYIVNVLMCIAIIVCCVKGDLGYGIATMLGVLELPIFAIGLMAE